MINIYESIEHVDTVQHRLPNPLEPCDNHGRTALTRSRSDDRVCDCRHALFKQLTTLICHAGKSGTSNLFSPGG